jgi:hypothetical protein
VAAHAGRRRLCTPPPQAACARKLSLASLRAGLVPSAGAAAQLLGSCAVRIAKKESRGMKPGEASSASSREGMSRKASSALRWNRVWHARTQSQKWTAPLAPAEGRVPCGEGSAGRESVWTGHLTPRRQRLTPKRACCTMALPAQQGLARLGGGGGGFLARASPGQLEPSTLLIWGQPGLDACCSCIAQETAASGGAMSGSGEHAQAGVAVRSGAD